MASMDVMSIAPVDITPAASLEVHQLDNLCSGNLDVLLSEIACNSCNSPTAAAAAAELPSLQVAGRSPAAAFDPIKAAKLRAAREYVSKSWQYKVGPVWVRLLLSYHNSCFRHCATGAGRVNVLLPVHVLLPCSCVCM